MNIEKQLKKLGAETNRMNDRFTVATFKIDDEDKAKSLVIKVADMLKDIDFGMDKYKSKYGGWIIRLDYRHEEE